MKTDPLARDSKYRKLKNRDDHNCFGCSPSNDKGLRMEFYTDEEIVCAWVTVPAHMCGWENLVHGGIISTILDETMSWTAITMLKKFILTKSISVDFLKPLYVGAGLRAEGRLVERLSDREAIVEAAIYDEHDVACARSRGRFALLSDDFFKKKGILDEKEAEKFRSVRIGE